MIGPKWIPAFFKSLRQELYLTQRYKNPLRAGEQPSLSSGWSDASLLNRRRPGPSVVRKKSKASRIDVVSYTVVDNVPCRNMQTLVPAE